MRRPLESAEADSTTPPRQIDPLRYVVWPMAALIIWLLVIAAYFSDRRGGDDELGLFNPTYMDVQYGKATYPIYGFYDSMPVHPPIHYKAIAVFMRAGLTLYYAQATPTVLWLLLCIWLIVRSRFPSAVKVGLLFGVGLTYLFFCNSAIELFAKGPVGVGWGLELFGMRPEGELGGAWIAGLLLLEAGRQDRWSLSKLFAGAVVLTYAASLHYYGTAAVLGAAVYAASAWWELGWPRAKSAMGVIAAGCVLYGLAELILWVIPQHADILYMIRNTGAHEGILAAIREHVALYQYWASQSVGPSWLRLPFLLGLPVVLISTPVLIAMRSTRVLALAVLPLQLFLLLFAWHKHPYYFIHEIGLYGAAVAAGVLTLLNLVLRKMPGMAWKAAVGLAAAGWLGYSSWNLARSLTGIALSLQPRVHEAEIARAAAREILGPNAKVASRLGLWYASGGADWFNVAPKLLWNTKLTTPEATRYLSHFDAIAESRHMSDATSNPAHKTLVWWYLDGDLRLRGFFFAAANNALSNLLFQFHAAAPVRGYALKAGRLFSFVERSAGDHELVVIVGPYGDRMTTFGERALFHDILPLPASGPGPQQALLAAVIGPDGPRWDETTVPNCRVIQKIPLSLGDASTEVLVAKLRREDRPIRFHEPGVLASDRYIGGEADLDQSGFADPPPPGAVPLTKAIRIEELAPAGGTAKVEWGPSPLITAEPGMGSFAAAGPVHWSSSAGVAATIQIRAKVLKGCVGFGLLSRRTRDFLTDPSLLCETGGKAVDVYLGAPSLSGADEWIVRNQKNGVASQALLQQVTVWIAKKDWEQQRAVFGELR